MNVQELIESIVERFRAAGGGGRTTTTRVVGGRVADRGVATGTDDFDCEEELGHGVITQGVDRWKDCLPSC